MLVVRRTTQRFSKKNRDENPANINRTRGDNHAGSAGKFQPKSEGGRRGQAGGAVSAALNGGRVGNRILDTAQTK